MKKSWGEGRGEGQKPREFSLSAVQSSLCFLCNPLNVFLSYQLEEFKHLGEFFFDFSFFFFFGRCFEIVGRCCNVTNVVFLYCF